MILIVRRVTARVRVVRHAMEQANIVANAGPRVKTNTAKEQERAHIANMANAPNVKAVVKIHVFTVPVPEIVGCVVAQERIWEVHVHRVKAVGVAPNAMERALLGFAQDVMEVVSAIHATVPENVRYVMVLVIANIAVDNLNAVLAEVTVTVPNAKITTVNVLTVVAAAMFG